jgi:hypothetical protein
VVGLTDEDGSGGRREKMLPMRLDRIRANARAAATEDLLDRITVFRNGMEPEALEIIEEELRLRGVGDAEIEEHERRRADVIVDDAGVARACSFCRNPAVDRRWGWHWLWGKVPIFPRRFWYCPDHRPPHS